jgi:hypothetical protein
MATIDSCPVQPVPPQPEDCCHSGCMPCVFDWYEENMRIWRAAMAEWERRQTAGDNK